MRDILDIGNKGLESPLGSPLEPVYPDNVNTMSPHGWDRFLWDDLGPMFGLGLQNYQRDLTFTDAVGLSIALQCADIKAQDMAKAEMILWRKKRRQWVEVEPREHWLARMLMRRPNQYQTWNQFWRQVILHYELAQNAYIVKDIARDGTVLQLLPVPPARARERVGENGQVYYEIAASNEFERAMLGGADNVILPSERVVHLKGRLWNGLTGMSNVALGGGLFRLIDAIKDYQTNLFGSDGTLPLVFETDQAFQGEMADAAFRRLKQQLTERVRKNARSGDPLLLEAGLTAKTIAVNARDSMTAEAFNALVARICGLMRVPPQKIYALETVKYDNQAAGNQAYATDCLVPTAESIEQSLRDALLTEDEWDTYWPEFDRLTMMATDLKTLGEVLDKALKSGAIEVNEYRERIPLGLSPIEGGDVRYVPVAVAIVDRNGKIIQQAATGQNEGAGQGGGNQESGAEGAEERDLRLVFSK